MTPVPCTHIRLVTLSFSCGRASLSVLGGSFASWFRRSTRDFISKFDARAPLYLWFNFVNVGWIMFGQVRQWRKDGVSSGARSGLVTLPTARPL